MPLTLRSSLRKAVRARLLTLASLPPVLWEGERTTVPVGSLYLRETLLVAPDSAEPITLGPTPFQRIRARYEVMVVAPFPEQGTSRGTPVATNATPLRVAESWADQIAAHFAVGTMLTAEGREFRVDRCATGQARIERSDHAVCVVAVALSGEFTSPL